MLERTHVRWLLDQLPELVDRGVLEPPAARALADHYTLDRQAADGQRDGSRAVLLFGVLGALLVGGGVILVLAHNWDQLSRAARTAIALVPLVLAAGLAAWVAVRRPAAAWREPAAVAWSLAVLSSLSLVAQTYHLAGHWTELVLVWLLLTLPVVYLLDAAAGAALYLLGTVPWVWERGFGDQHGTGFWLLLAAVLPFVVHRLRRSPRGGASGLLGVALAATLAAGFAPGLGLLFERLPAPLLATGFLALLLAAEAVAAPALARPLRGIGGAGALVTFLALSFSEAWQGPLRGGDGWRGGEGSGVALETALQATLAAVLLLAALAAGWRRRSGAAAGWIAGVAVVWLAQDLAVLAGGLAAMLLINLFLLALGVAHGMAGFRQGDLRRVNAAMGLLALVVLLRFFDSEVDFLVRGLAFIVLGLGFFLLNFLLLRRRGRSPAADGGLLGG